MAKVPAARLRQQVTDAAELLHITELLARYPSQTSGGQRQRIAVARALAMQPQVLLMDEPLSNLDALLRLEARAELKRLLREIGSTTIYVTHDQVEALSMGDRVAVMRSGEIVQVGEPLDVYDAPVDRFVGGFIGNPPMNFLTARVTRRDGGAVAQLGNVGALPVDGEGAPEGEALLGIRAEHVDITGATGEGGLRGRVLVVEPLGSHNLVTLQIGDEQLKAITRPEERLEVDAIVPVVIDGSRIRWIRDAPPAAVEVEKAEARAG
jgi:multiple sugar transport system ATP-binding protein